MALAVYAFWLFSFERYNGILGSYKTNNRSIEIQLMRHFVQEMEIDKLSIKDDNFNIHAIVAELVQQPAAFGTLNDMLVQHSNSHLQLHDASKLPVNEVNITVWYYLDPYHLAGVSIQTFFLMMITLFI